MLLDLDDIARMFKVTRAYARDTLTKLEDFPQMAPGSTVKMKRWREVDVLEYLGLEMREDG